MKRIAILGSTGSIGRSTLSIVESFPDRFSVVSMAAGNNVELAYEQARRWRPQILSMATAEAADQLQHKLKQAGISDIVITHGSKGHGPGLHPSRRRLRRHRHRRRRRTRSHL